MRATPTTRRSFRRCSAAELRASIAEPLTLAALVAASVLLCGLPLALVARLGMGGGFDLDPLAQALASPAVRSALLNSLDSALVSAALATLLGAALASLVALTDLRARGLLILLLLLPIMIPSHVVAIAWIQALGPASAPLRWLGMAPPPGTTNILYGRGGVIFLLALQHAPLVFLVVRAGLRALPRDLLEAARVSGAGPWTMLRRVAAPLMAPTLVAAFALAFVSALGNFGIPALLGAPGRYVTAPVLMWRRLASFGPSALADMAVIATLIGALAVLAVAAQMRLQRRAGAALSGAPATAPALRLGRARIVVEGAVWAVVALTLVLPMTALLTTALTPTFGVPLNLDTLTVEHFHAVLVTQSVTLRAFANSTLAAGGAALALAGMAVALGYFLSRPPGASRRIAGVAATLAEIAFAVPGIVISVAFILAFIRPVLGVPLYGSLTLIGLAYMAAFFAIALKPVSAAYGALDGALDDAARVSGAGFLRRLTRIHAPLVAPAAASGATLVFLTAYSEVTVSALLWSTGSETVGTVIFNYEDGGAKSLAAAMSVVCVIATIALMALLDRLGRRAPPGVVPWR